MTNGSRISGSASMRLPPFMPTRGALNILRGKGVRLTRTLYLLGFPGPMATERFLPNSQRNAHLCKCV